MKPQLFGCGCSLFPGEPHTKGCAYPNHLKPKPKRLVQELRWRGKSYPIHLCIYCGKESPKFPKLDVLPTIRNGNTILAMQFSSEGMPCSKCLYRVAEDMEKAASELRAACAGGVYSEKELK